MSSVGSTGLNSLTEYLSGTSSPLLSTGLSASEIQTVVKGSSPGDVVQLSDEALQLQNIGNMFGNQETSQQSDTTDGFAALAQSEQGSQSDSVTSEDQSQITEMDALFGATKSNSDTSGNSLNVVF